MEFAVLESDDWRILCFPWGLAYAYQPMLWCGCF